MVKVLVTGSTGFIGSHLVPLLSSSGYEVVCLNRYIVGRLFEGTRAKVVYADLNDHAVTKEIIGREQPQIVVHLASISPVAYSYEHYAEVQQTNYLATVNLAEACRQNIKDFKQFVFAGTSEEYGQQANFPIKESADLKPNSPYAVSKAAADKYLRMMYDAYAFPVTVMRPFNTYGRLNNYHFVTERIIYQMLTGSTLNLGDPTPLRDFLYIDDHTDAYMKAIGNEKATDRAYNVCSGRGVLISEYIDKIAKIAEWNGTVNWKTIPNRPNDISILVGDNSKIKAQLGWTPKVPLEVGLKLTVERIREKLKCPIVDQHS